MSYFTGLETGHMFSEDRCSTISVTESEACTEATTKLIASFLILLLIKNTQLAKLTALKLK